MALRNSYMNYFLRLGMNLLFNVFTNSLAARRKRWYDRRLHMIGMMNPQDPFLNSQSLYSTASSSSTLMPLKPP